MAKEVAIGKRAKISEAQQMMILSVVGASLFLGAAISISVHMIKQIAFNAKVIVEEDQSIVAYSNAIKQTGICKSPAGEVYTKEELDNCNPDAIDVSEIPNTLRANILNDLAANDALNSVSTGNDRSCINIKTDQMYTYNEMKQMYDAASKANDSNMLNNASKLIKVCSALRVIPDALPSFKNEEALLASLNKIFNISHWVPESLSPSGTSSSVSASDKVHTISVNLSVEANSATTMTVLNNIERSIREFNINNATIEWDADGLNLNAQATAYYVDETTLNETTKIITAEEEEK